MRLRNKALRILVLFLPRMVGVIFALSAIAKSLDFPGFYNLFLAYGIVPRGNLAVFLCLELIFIEVFLGCSIISGLDYKKRIYRLSILFLIFLSGVATYGHFFSKIENCGCFGNIVILNYTQNIFKNCIMILFLLWGQKETADKVYSLNKNPSFITYSIMFFLVIASLCLGGFRARALQHSSEGAKKPDWKMYNLKTTNGILSLRKGGYGVALLSANCFHCQRSIKYLNDLVSEYQNVIAICASTSDQSSLNQLKCPHAFVPNTVLSDLVVTGTPEFVIVINGIEVQRFLGEIDQQQKQNISSALRQLPFQKIPIGQFSLLHNQSPAPK